MHEKFSRSAVDKKGAEQSIEDLFSLVLSKYSRAKKASCNNLVLYFDHPLSFKHDRMTMSIGRKLNGENIFEFQAKVQIKNEKKETPIQSNALKKYLLKHALTVPIIGSYAEIRPY
jgi:hypothetical protein